MTFNVASRTPITARADVVIRQAAAKALGWQRWERESSDPGSAPGTTSFNDFAALFGNAAKHDDINNAA
jgi:hypothetical protein